jgi:hypothetical protein
MKSKDVSQEQVVVVKLRGSGVDESLNAKQPGNLGDCVLNRLL